MEKKKNKESKLDDFIALGVALLGIAAIALTAFLKTDKPKGFDDMTIDELKKERLEACKAQDYEKAAIIRDIIKQKQKV